MKYSDEQRLQKILDNAEKLLSYISEHNVTKEQLLNDYSLQWLVTTSLYNIGEHFYRISAEYKNLHTDIPWLMIAGLRHRLVHDYDGTNWNIISEVVFNELPELTEKIKLLLENSNQIL